MSGRATHRLSKRLIPSFCRSSAARGCPSAWMSSRSSVCAEAADRDMFPATSRKCCSEGVVREVADAPSIEQPVFAATRIRRKLDPSVNRALAILYDIIKDGEYGFLER